jgi:hypothetical protein
VALILFFYLTRQTTVSNIFLKKYILVKQEKQEKGGEKHSIYIDEMIDLFKRTIVKQTNENNALIF